MRLWLRALRAAAGPGPGSGARYEQGQRPEPRIREYFYCIDLRGQLFLDDSKVKNFITCFKDTAFLATFFSRLEPNRSGRYEGDFPFLWRCGRERNFLRCADRPLVFTALLPPAEPGAGPRLSCCGAGELLALPFLPQSLAVAPGSGRLYHPGPARLGGVGLVSSALALEWSAGFEYGEGPARPPTHFSWGGQRYRLTGELAPLLGAGTAPAVPPEPCPAGEWEAPTGPGSPR